MRQRVDKTAPNAVNTALSVMDSFNEPILKEDILSVMSGLYKSFNPTLGKRS
jgi:hypothetical protein